MSWKQNTAVPVIIGTPSGLEPAGYLVYDPDANIMYISEGGGDFAGWEIDVFHMVSVVGGGTATLSGVAATAFTENWPYSGSGIATLSGAATASLDTIHEAYAGSGSAIFYGTAASEKEDA